MARFPDPYNSNNPFTGGFARPRPLDYGRESTPAVAAFFNAVYAWMATGLALTGVVAWLTYQHPQVLASLGMGGIIVLFLVEIGLVVAISGAINRISATAATALFLLYSALNGLLLSGIFVVYTHASIASTFLVTAGAFGATSVYGYVTKRDLTRVGSLAFMALIGLILASLVNLFLHSPALYWLVSYAGVLIFTALTAYDTQKLKEIAYQTAGDPRLSARLAISGSLALYLDFINLFLFLLRILGNRRN